jgi:hypothetical protein
VDHSTGNLTVPGSPVITPTSCATPALGTGSFGTEGVGVGPPGPLGVLAGRQAWRGRYCGRWIRSLVRGIPLTTRTCVVSGPMEFLSCIAGSVTQPRTITTTTGPTPQTSTVVVSTVSTTAAGLLDPVELGRGVVGQLVREMPVGRRRTPCRFRTLCIAVERGHRRHSVPTGSGYDAREAETSGLSVDALHCHTRSVP